MHVTATVVSVPAGPGFEGDATSDADGNWAIPVPGPGIYRVALDRDTIPEGFALEHADRYQLPRFQMFPGATVRNAVFAFQSSEGGGIEVPTRWERVIRLLVSGIRFGLIIGVCSVGLSLIYGTTGLVNFAHGELVTLGALLVWFFNLLGRRSDADPRPRVDHRHHLEWRLRGRARAGAVAADGAAPQRADRADVGVDRPRARSCATRSRSSSAPERSPTGSTRRKKASTSDRSTCRPSRTS